MKTYNMVRQKGGDAYVTVQKGTYRSPLRLRLDLAKHSPTGFEWGYGGSGPAQLALALLADALQDDERAKRHYQNFKFGLVAKVGRDESWSLTDEDVQIWVEDQERAKCET